MNIFKKSQYLAAVGFSLACLSSLQPANYGIPDGGVHQFASYLGVLWNTCMLFKQIK